MKHGLRYMSDSDPYRPPFIRCLCLREFHSGKDFAEHLLATRDPLHNGLPNVNETKG